MRVGWVEGSIFVLGPGFATTRCRVVGRPVFNSFFVVAQNIQDSCMFDEHRLEGWSVARNLVRQHLHVPLA